MEKFQVNLCFDTRDHTVRIVNDNSIYFAVTLQALPSRNLRAQS